MADLSITAANVAAQGGASIGEKISGAAITAGEVLAVNSSGRAILASDATAALSKVLGIALNDAASGQPIKYMSGGRVNLGATLAVGKLYVLSTDGGIAPVDDIASSDYPSFLGAAESTSILVLQPLSAPAAAAGAVS